MDVAQVFRELWLRRLWVLPGVLVALIVALAVGWHLTLLPPKLESKDLTLHSADTVVLVDSPTSVIADFAAPLKQLSGLAGIYARFMTSFPVREAIAERAKLPVDKIVASAPLVSSQTGSFSEPLAADRSEALLDERKSYRLEFRTDAGLPTVTIFAGAPTTREAIRLADAAALGFKDYIRRLEAARQVPLKRRVIIRQLGAAEGGTIGKNVKATAVIAAGIGAFIGWCILVLLANNIVRGWRKLDGTET